MLGIKSIVLLVTLVSCISLAKCEIYRTMPETHPDHPGKCWWNQTNTAYSPGDKFTPMNTCSEVWCLDDFSFESLGCGVSIIDDPTCKRIDHDLSLPYPKCCVAYECTDAEGNVTRI